MIQAFDADSSAPRADALALWEGRPGARVLATAGTVVLVTAAVALVALDGSGDVPYDAALVESPGYWLAALVLGVMLGACGALWVSVVVGAWLGALVLALSAFGADPSSAPFTVCVAGAVALATVALLGTVNRRRQALAARSWATARHHVPDAEPGARAHLQRWRGAWTLTGVGLGVAGLLGAGMFAHEHRAAQEFRSDAIESTGTVVEVAGDDLSAVVDVEGLLLDVPLPSVYLEAGEQVVVRYDGSGRAELVDDVADPSMWLALAGAGLVSAPVVLAREAARRRRVAMLLAHGGPAVRLRATWDGTGGATLAALDAPGRAAVRARDIVGLALLPEPTEAEPFDPFGRPVEQVSDGELLDLARRMAAEAAGDVPLEEATGAALPPTWSSTEVLVIGLVDDRFPIAIQAPDGSWYATETGARPAGAAVRDRRMSRLDDHPGTIEVTESTTASTATTRLGGLERLGRRTGTVGPWLALPVLALLAWWLGPEVRAWWSTLFATFGAASALHAWAWTATPALHVTGRALVDRRPVLDRHIPWSRVRDVAADESALVVRIDASSTEEADALMCAARPGGDLLRGTHDPRQARERILAARASGLASATAGTSTRRLPSPPAMVAVLGALAMVGGFVLGGS